MTEETESLIARAKQFDRLVIAGVPKAGKTRLATGLWQANPEVLPKHTDDLIGRLEWSEASAEVARHWFGAPSPWIIEGVAAPRALRKWLEAHAGKPCDAVVWMDTPFETLSGRQDGMAKGCRTVWQEIEMKLRSRGVEILR